MDQITYSLQSLNLDKDLEHDVDYIIYCFENEIISMDYNNFKIKRYVYHNLYTKIVTLLSEKCYSHNLLDMMPLIDEYIEYYSRL
jgi:hypothetical protein